jgi:hypothetical protein
MTVFEHSAAPHTMSILSRSSTRQMLLKVPADAGCLCDKVFVLREAIKETLSCLSTDFKDSRSSISLCLWHMALLHHHRVSSAHNTLPLSGSVNKPRVSGGVEFAARIVVTVFRHNWRQENQCTDRMKCEAWEGLMNQWKKVREDRKGIMYVSKEDKN